MHGSIPNAEAVSVACGVASHALVEATLAEIPGLRDQPVPEGVSALPPRFLRHCDEQTVVGMRAVLAAIAAHPEPRPSFAGYGVVAAQEGNKLEIDFDGGDRKRVIDSFVSRG